MIHIPLVISGDVPVKNCGKSFVKSSFLQTTFPVAASRQESTPPTPNVTIFPSPTAGVLLGPGCALAEGPEIASAAYLSCQISFPVAASRHIVTSSLPTRPNE